MERTKEAACRVSYGASVELDDDLNLGVRFVIEVVAAIIQRDEKYFVARRKTGKHLEGFWEFPGGKIEEGESPENSLQRELQEEFGVTVEVGAFLGENTHDYGSAIIRLRAYRVVLNGDLKESTDHDAMDWCTLTQLKRLQLAPADVPLLKYI